MNNPQSLNDISALQERVEAIRNRVKLQAGFYRNLSTYVLVITGLWIINFLTVGSPDRPRPIWVWWVTIFWGVSMLIWGFTVFGAANGLWFGAQWQENKVRALMAKENLCEVSADKRMIQAQLRL